MAKQILPAADMRNIFIAICCLCFTLCGFESLGFDIAAQARETTARESVSQNAAANEFADRQATEWIARGIPGLALAVAVDGATVYSKGFGYANLKKHKRVRTDTRFRIGSISKSLTAVGLMELAQSGKIDLDAPVQKYVPTFPDKGAPITGRMLAGHLSGIRHYKDGEWTISKHYGSVLDGLSIFRDDPLVSAPGKSFNYSSFGFNLLSAEMQSAAGEDFLEYMQTNVFDPLDLTHTMPDLSLKKVKHRTHFYERTDAGQIKRTPYIDNSYKWAGGGFISTAEDLVRFGSALMQPGILNAESLHTMFTPQKTDSGKETKYGIGWFIEKSASGKTIYHHTGVSIGGHSELIIYPERHIAIALVTNLSDANWERPEIEAVAEKFEPINKVGKAGTNSEKSRQVPVGRDSLISDFRQVL